MRAEVDESRRATTIDVPGLTKSKVSPDGRIASRDLGSKLVSALHAEVSQIFF
jgi:hypothetical protein